MVNLNGKKIIRDIAGAIIGGLVLSYSLLVCIHVVEYILPTSFWFEYIGVTPTKTEYKVGETLAFISETIRHRDVEMVWQDTAYCKETPDGIFNKHKTQRRPEEETELMTKGKRKGERKYFVPIYKEMTICKMCGSAIGITSRGYKKTYSYCTEEFKVNI